MDTFYQFISVLSSGMDKPQPYGWFHIMWLAIVVAACVIAFFTLRKASDRKIRFIVLSFALVMLFFEVLKQLQFSFYSGEFSYQWYAFPFQFCSVPMYAALLASVIKKGRVQNALYSFIATYGAIAGLSVMLYPNTVSPPLQ